MPPFALPSDYPRIKKVGSFDELVSTRFAEGVNALCWERTLAGDFGEVVERLGAGEAITVLDDARLRSLPVTAAGRVAVERLLEDQRRLRAHDLDPVLNCIHGYPREEDPGPVPTDVFSFHVDSATVETDTWLCTYHGPASEGLRNGEARRRVDVPETRAELWREWMKERNAERGDWEQRDQGQEQEQEFREWQGENCYDLHYAPELGAQPFSFGLGNLWRIAVAWPGSPVPPCIHRAPGILGDQPPRLLLIS
jgi:hypothetical protein